MTYIKDYRFLLFATIGLAVLLRITAVTYLDIKPTSDAYAYMQMATSMLNTGTMDDGDGNVAFYSAGYPLFLVPFFAAFQATPEVAQFVNIALGIGTVFLIYLCSAAILPNRRWAVLPALIWATYPPALLYTEYVLKENFLIPLLLLQTYLLMGYPKSTRKHLRAFAIGLIFGVEMLVGAAVLFTGALIALVVTGFYNKSWDLRSSSWRAVLFCGLGFALAITPWLAYTHAKLGQAVLNTNGGFNLYLGNNPEATGYFVGIQETPMAPSWHAMKKEKGEIGSTAVLKRLAIEHMLANPGQTIALSFKKLAYFWWPPLHEGKYGNQSTMETMMRLAWLIYYLVIMGFALIPLIGLRGPNRCPLLLLYGTALLYCGIHAAAYVIYRYRLPAMPLMTILAGAGMHYAYVWCATARTRFRTQNRSSLDQKIFAGQGSLSQDNARPGRES